MTSRHVGIHVVLVLALIAAGAAACGNDRASAPADTSKPEAWPLVPDARTTESGTSTSDFWTSVNDGLKAERRPKDAGWLMADRGVPQPDSGNMPDDTLGVCSAWKPDGADIYGESANLGDSAGGGAGYRAIVTTGKFVVKTLADLKAALAVAVSGDVVFVDGSVEIDMLSTVDLAIPGGVTLASNRGFSVGGTVAPGARLYSNHYDSHPVLKTKGANVRITGLRLQGPDSTVGTLSDPLAKGIVTEYPGLEVDNCEMWAWPRAAVGFSGSAVGGHVHHNSIHHNQRTGYGYGVEVNSANGPWAGKPAFVLIEANIFDYYRHAITAWGSSTESYTARYNVFGPNSIAPAVDVHGGCDRGDGTNIAGDTIIVHHNTFSSAIHAAFQIRGVPAHGAELHHNLNTHFNSSWADKMFIQSSCVGVFGNFYVCANKYADGKIVP